MLRKNQMLILTYQGKFVFALEEGQVSILKANKAKDGTHEKPPDHADCRRWRLVASF